MGRRPDRGFTRTPELKHPLPVTELRRGVEQPPNCYLALGEGFQTRSVGLETRSDPYTASVLDTQAAKTASGATLGTWRSMSQTERHKRLRLLIRKMNKQRKRQANQIDILCHDLIGAQRSFIHRLQDVGFAAEFYRSLLGSTDVNGILARAGRIIKQELPGAGVAFFLRQPDGCEFHPCPGDESLCSEEQGPQECLDPDLVESICKLNRPCTLEEILDLGANGDLATLRRFSLVTLPLSDLGRSLGFVLIYCPRPQVLNMADVRRVVPVMRGLAQAVRAVRVPLSSRS